MRAQDCPVCADIDQECILNRGAVKSRHLDLDHWASDAIRTLKPSANEYHKCGGLQDGANSGPKSLCRSDEQLPPRLGLLGEKPLRKPADQRWRRISRRLPAKYPTNGIRSNPSSV